MDGYINKQATIDALIEWYGCKPNDIEAFKEIIEALPPADVEPVIRCKDCIFGNKYYFEVVDGIPDIWVECKNPKGLNRDVSGNGYCSAGIRGKINGE